MFVIGFPLLLVPLAILNILVFLMPGATMTAPLFTVGLYSGASWTMTLSDAVLALALLLLVIEMAKAARPGAKTIVDDGLALLVAAGATAEFLWLKGFATSTFFLLTALTYVDLVASPLIRSKMRRPAPMTPAVPVSRDIPAPRSDPAPTNGPDAAPEAMAGQPSVESRGAERFFRWSRLGALIRRLKHQTPPAPSTPAE